MNILCNHNSNGRFIKIKQFKKQVRFDTELEFVQFVRIQTITNVLTA